jgi:site-specific DNA-methyltransferase (adenine-specific)
MIQKGKKQVPMYKDEWVLKESRETNKTTTQLDKEFDYLSSEGMWQKLNKRIKPNGAIVLFGSEPFSSALRMSNSKNYKYDWVWKKNAGSNFATVKYQPFKEHENVLVFSRNGGKTTYKPQMEERSESGKNRVKTKVKPNSNAKKGVYGEIKEGYPKTMNELRYPSSVQKFNRERGLHPTQKPVALGQYLIRTYTNKGETILDFTAGSGSFGVSAIREGRMFIGIELNNEYFKIMEERIKKELQSNSGYGIL